MLDIAQKAPSTAALMAAFFDDYVHDSYAGFSASFKEATGYWRYRKGFRGDDNATIALNKDIDTGRIVS